MKQTSYAVRFPLRQRSISVEMDMFDNKLYIGSIQVRHNEVWMFMDRKDTQGRVLAFLRRHGIDAVIGPVLEFEDSP